jgi:hypothetical protein
MPLDVFMVTMVHTASSSRLYAEDAIKTFDSLKIIITE